MGKALYSATELHAAVSAHPGAFAAFGPGDDVDAAFDEAVSAAGYEYGFADLLPSITAADASDVQPFPTAPLTVDRALALAQQHTRDAAATAAAAAADDAADDAAVAAQPVVMAWPVAAPAAHARRRVRVVVDDPTLDLPTAQGTVLDPSPQLVAALAAAGAAAGDGEVLERVELRVRARFRPVVTVNGGASENGFAVLDPATATLLSTGHKTAGVARREAVALLKAKPASELDTPDLHVVKVVGRAGGLPLVRVHRARLAQKVTAKVVFASEKKPGATKVAGWLFAGVLPR